MRTLPSQPSDCSRVDDCTTFAQGGAAVIGLVWAAGRAAADAECTGMRLSVIKSGVVATTPLQTAMMCLAAGPLIGCTEALKDLGVVQGSWAAEASTAMARCSTACDLLAKVASLSCSMAAKAPLGWQRP